MLRYTACTRMRCFQQTAAASTPSYARMLSTGTVLHAPTASTTSGGGGAIVMSLGEMQSSMLTGAFKRTTDAFEALFTHHIAAMRAGSEDQAAKAGGTPGDVPSTDADRINYHLHSFTAISSNPLPTTAPFLTTYGSDARDVAITLMRAYTAQGRIDGVRDVFHLAIEALHRAPRFSKSPTTICAHSHCTAIVDTYLDILTMRSNFSRDDAFYVLRIMDTAGIPKSPLTYLYLTELHLRMEKDPIGLWSEMTGFEGRSVTTSSKSATQMPSSSSSLLELVRSSGDDLVNFGYNTTGSSSSPPSNQQAMLATSSAFLTEHTLRTLGKPLHAASKWMLQYVAPHTKDVSYAFSIVSAALEGGKIDKSHMASLAAAWCTSDDVPPEMALWMLFQLELRCLCDEYVLMHMIQKSHLAHLLLRCVKSGDTQTAERILALMERNIVEKKGDIPALLVWGYSQTEEVEKAFDTLEHMARSELLTKADPFQKFTLESVSHSMDRHYLMAAADMLGSKELVDRAFNYLTQRHRDGKSVSVHSLDTVVLACSKIGDETRALEALDSFKLFGVQPRTNSYNCLLLASVGKRKTSMHRAIFERMLEDAVAPNSLTFRLVIRQSVLNENIDEAMWFLERASTFGRVEIEFVLPIVERASRAGDVDTVYRLAKYALDCNVGIDPVVLHNVIKALRDHGCDTTAITEMVPLHEQLRSRSSSARRRVRHEVPTTSVTA